MSDQDRSPVKIDPYDLVPVSPDEFIPGSKLPVNVFLRLSEGHYICIGRQGTKTNFNEMHFSGKQDAHVQTYYIRRSDFAACVGSNLTIAGIVLNANQVTESKKLNILNMAADSVFKEFAELGFNIQSIEHAKMVSQGIRTIVESKPDLHSVVSLMSAVPGDLVRHSMAVSAIAVIIAKNMGWVSPGTIEKIALGGLLHDVGYKELPPDVIRKPRHELSYEERATFETHPFRGIEILKTMPSVPDDILSIVYEHHENAIGHGYPRKIRDYKMNPLARIVALADCFVELTIKNHDLPNPRSAGEGLNYIETTLAQPFNKQAFHALRISLDKVAKPSLKVVS